MHTSRSKRPRPRPRPARAFAVLLCAATLALAGCSGAGGGDSGDQKSDAGARSRPDAGAAGSGRAGAESGAKKAPKLTGVHIIRTASLSVRVADVPAALDKARAAAEDAGGIVGDETTDRDGRGHERSRLTLRVPQEAYQDVLDRLSGAGRLLERDVRAKDVTDQVVDVDSRVASQRASVARVRELMDRATKLSDVVALEGELSGREAELEALLAQQASLKDRTTLATITLRLSEAPARTADDDDDETGLLDALSGGWNAFVTALTWVALVLAAVLPFAAVAVVLAFLWLRLVRPRLRRREGDRPARPAAAPQGQD